MAATGGGLFLMSEVPRCKEVRPVWEWNACLGELLPVLVLVPRVEAEGAILFPQKVGQEPLHRVHLAPRSKPAFCVGSGKTKNLY